MKKASALVVMVAALVAGASGGARSGDLRASSARAVVERVLDRIAYGPRPGDVDRVTAIGLSRYIDEQLHPERIDDRAVDARLATFTTLRMSSGELAARYEEPLMEARRARKVQAADPGNPDARKMIAPEAREANRPLVELAAARLIRAVYSERQLQEVLTDFWFNHFNVDARKGPDRFMLTEYERDAIRPHVLGRFRDLLGATAKSPAMLFYLDNWMSADPNGPHVDPRARQRRGFGRFGRFDVPDMMMARPQRKNAPRGLNENYGRELMELHTVGVDGGYTQQDVIEVARAFTGWTISNPRQGGEFRFAPALHDNGEKVVLGHLIPAGGGERDGEEVLDILAASPATARHIAFELVQRFVSDTPPPALVDRTAARFLDTGGDLREVMRTILTSPEFLSPDGGAKAKTPLEFLASALRTSGAEIGDALPLVHVLQRLGMPLYQCQPPTGYKDTAEAWVSSGALVNRMNIAVALAADRLPGVTVHPGAPEDVMALALRLGGPDFQRK
jgi:uncharacterized protein (DUF1800 family)